MYRISNDFGLLPSRLENAPERHDSTQSSFPTGITVGREARKISLASSTPRYHRAECKIAPMRELPERSSLGPNGWANLWLLVSPQGEPSLWFMVGNRRVKYSWSLWTGKRRVRRISCGTSLHAIWPASREECLYTYHMHMHTSNVSPRSCVVHNSTDVVHIAGVHTETSG